MPEPSIVERAEAALSVIKGGPLPGQPVDGAVLLDAVRSFLSRFVAYPSPGALAAHVLWCAHTHLMDAWESTPRLAFLSPEPGSGKTRALEITETLVPRALETVNASSAAIFRKVSDEDGLPTLLYDEIDTLFGPKAGEHEDVRGFINAGHRRGAMALRCVMRGKEYEVVEFPAFCAVALAGLGNLPDTILTRSVVVAMRRRAPNETVEPYRRREHSGEGYALRGELALWATSVKDRAPHLRPTMPPEIQDRDADVWEPLFAVADLAGGEWPTVSRVAAVAVVAATKARTPSLGIKLLSDIKKLFGSMDSMATDDLIKGLIAMDEAPWGDMKGRPIDPRRLARLLKPYGISSQNLRAHGAVVKGYSREALHDTWNRYVPDELGSIGIVNATAATTATSCARCSGEGCQWCQ